MFLDFFFPELCWLENWASQSFLVFFFFLSMILFSSSFFFKIFFIPISYCEWRVSRVNSGWLRLTRVFFFKFLFWNWFFSILSFEIKLLALEYCDFCCFSFYEDILILYFKLHARQVNASWFRLLFLEYIFFMSGKI